PLEEHAVPHESAVSGEYLFWYNWEYGTIARSDLDGSNVHPKFIEGVVDNPGTGESIKFLTIAGEYVFWSANGEEGSRRIGRAKINGTSVNRYFLEGFYGINGIAADSSYLYWIDSENPDRDPEYNPAEEEDSGYVIGRATLEGAGVDRSFITGFNSYCAVCYPGPWARQPIRGLAVAGGYLYMGAEWTHVGPEEDIYLPTSIGRVAKTESSSPELGFINGFD